MAGKSLELGDTFDAVWKTLGPSAARHDVGTRMRPAEHSAGTAERAAVEALARLDFNAAESQRLKVGKTLGVGGMGVVRRAVQTSMAREVAVKTLRDDLDEPDRAALSLLQEAWITGAVEHPNVVPVHDVSMDEDGRPRIVLKRIEGTPWSTQLDDPEGVRHRFGVDDSLEWHLQTLLQVCNAVHFAHCRGIVHRDLKPSNVMVGSFGEVYVMDWGIAVSVADDADGRFPLATESREMAGTPCYMAPEMLGGDAPPVDARTDVYLLGATLYRILAGHPPHRSDTMHALLREVLVSQPEPPRDAPLELVRVV